MSNHRFASRFDATAALTADSEDAVELGLFDETSHIKLLAEDAVLSSPDTGRFRWLVGLYGMVTQEDGTGELRARTATNPSRLVYLEARRDRRRERRSMARRPTTWAWAGRPAWAAGRSPPPCTPRRGPIHPVARVRSGADASAASRRSSPCSILGATPGCSTC
jgi:hypothetical protein